MLRELISTMALLVLLSGHASADEDQQLRPNAALKYWRGFATMQRFTPEDEKLLTNVLAAPLDNQAKDIVTKAEYALRLMHYGAALPHCEWAVDWKEEGVDARLPHLMGARSLTSIALLRARMRFAEGKDAEAIDDAVAAMTLGRHATLDGSLIGVLVGYAIEAKVYETLAVYLPRLDARQLADLKRRLDAVPAGNRPALAIRQCEENTIHWLVGKVKGAKDNESLVAMLAFVGLSEQKPGDANARARVFVAECGGSAEGIIRFAEETRPSYALMARILDLPPEQFEKEFERESAKRANNPVFKVFFPAMTKVRQSQSRAEIRRALFTAGLAVVRDGQGALKAHPDPIAGGPFEYTAFEGGFELRSKYKMADGKPLTLTFGQRH
jgi:Holliday junction resolvase